MGVPRFLVAALTISISIALPAGSAGAPRQARGSFVVAGYRLFAAPAAMAGQCRAAQAHVTFVLLCPTLLPRSGDGVTPGTAARLQLPGGLPQDGIGIQATTGAGDPWTGARAFVTVPSLFVGADYGGAAVNDLGLDNPNFFLDFFMLEGRVSPAQLDLAGQCPHQLSLGPWTIAGHPGYVYAMQEHYANTHDAFARCPGDGFAFVGQVTFVWHQHGITYAASLQRWSANPRDPSVLAVLTALVDHLAPG